VSGRDRAAEGAAPPAAGGEARPGDARPGRPPAGPAQMPGEVDGPKGPEPTRFGDWEKGGRCTDF
jgi:hypothetical protein